MLEELPKVLVIGEHGHCKEGLHSPAVEHLLVKRPGDSGKIVHMEDEEHLLLNPFNLTVVTFGKRGSLLMAFTCKNLQREILGYR